MTQMQSDITANEPLNINIFITTLPLFVSLQLVDASFG